ncbi:actin family [Cladochytrium replicatum]|nr:actin family [Cladochytrium replicatum]
MSLLGRRHSIYGTEDRIVFDIGSLFVKCGFSGESKPRYVTYHSEPQVSTTTQEGSRKGSSLHQLYKLEVRNLGEIEGLLSDTLRNLYHLNLLTDPKQRKVILCENVLLPIIVKEAISRVLFTVLQVPSITFLPSQVLALLTVGKTTGLVVDVGYNETILLPIYDGRPLLPRVRSFPIAGASMTKRFEQLLINHGSLIAKGASVGEDGLSLPIPEGYFDSQPKHFLDSLQARVCYIGSHPTQATLSTEFPSEKYPYKVYVSTAKPAVVPVEQPMKLMVPGWVRERAGEVLFESDEDGNTLATSILECILQCPSDTRTELAQNILVIGGTAMFPGFHERLQKHIEQAQEENDRYKKFRKLQSRLRILRSVFTPNCAAWIGGSLLGAVKAGGPEITREQFLAGEQIPDWTHYFNAA